MTVEDPSKHVLGRIAITLSERRAAELEVAGEIAALIGARAAEGRRTVLGLPTGGTPVGVYRELVRRHREEGLSFRHVVTFDLDEFCGLAPDHPASFARSMREQLFQHVDLAPGHVHFPDGRATDVERHCREYEAAIAAAGGIDLQLLGLGRNGHIAFNEPGASSDCRTRRVALDPSTLEDARAAFEGLGPVPTHALTMGVGTILEARRIRVLAFGAPKAPAVARALEGPVGPQTPASFLRAHPDVAFWIDRPAASRLVALELSGSESA